MSYIMYSSMICNRASLVIVQCIKRYETSGRKFAGEISTDGRKFAGEISTDGVGVSILMRVQAKKHEPEELQPKKARKKKFNSKKQTKEAPIDIQSYERVVGLDPGRKSLFVTCDMQNRHLECSSKEFYQDAKYLESRRKTKKWMDRDNEVKEAVTNMPTKKTCSLTVFQEYVSFLLPRLDTLLKFFQQRKFRNQKFKRYIFCKKKLSGLCLRITQGMKTIVGFGDWSNTDKAGVLKKCPAGPVKKLEEQLKKHCAVCPIDEFCTSKKCNYCKNDLYNEHKITTGKDGRKYRVKVHGVLHCHNSVCRSMTVDRDVNASAIHLSLLWCMLMVL